MCDRLAGENCDGRQVLLYEDAKATPPSRPPRPPPESGMRQVGGHLVWSVARSAMGEWLDASATLGVRRSTVRNLLQGLRLHTIQEIPESTRPVTKHEQKGWSCLAG
jgi:hypothetical protein